MGVHSNCWSITPTFRTLTARCPCSSGHASGIHSSSVPMPTAPTIAIASDATSITIAIVRKFADQTGFVVHPRR